MISSNRFNPEKGYLISFPEGYPEGEVDLASVTESLFRLLSDEADFSDKLDICYSLTSKKKEVQVVFKRNFPSEKLAIISDYILSLIPQNSRVEIIGRGFSSPVKISFDELQLLGCESLPISISICMDVEQKGFSMKRAIDC